MRYRLRSSQSGIRRSPRRIARHVLSNPREAVDRLANTLERALDDVPDAPPPYGVDVHWEMRLHAAIGAPWPCPTTADAESLWAAMTRDLRSGEDESSSLPDWCFDPGPNLLRAVWCLVRHLEPTRVVETGVARGVTTRTILEALERNRRGHLWSVDLPPEVTAWESQPAALLGGAPRRWTYVRGSSRRRLRPLLASLGEIDLFLHDSQHTRRNMLFELGAAWRTLRLGGALVADDIACNGAFAAFQERTAGAEIFVGTAEDGSPSFGVVLKSSA